ncbi:MAG: type II toxin-antitoxin system RelE/ParE family toxin [Bacteroidetes bacterium]|nr:MAG: type II toxin-antitoxin system RelE/ParE family toxin [Bacteroidota bacterium]
MTVHWTNTANAHLVAIYEYIAKDSPRYALRMVDKLTARSKQIAQFPYSGRIVPEYELNEVREIIEYPYRIIYRIKQEQIDVLAVIHGSRLLPENL